MSSRLSCKWVMVLAVLCLAAASIAPIEAKAQFPAKGKSIELIVPYAAGGSSDAGARMLAAGMEKVLGVPVLIVNKPGANGQLGWTLLSQSKPDGYTIGATNFPGVITSYLDKDRKAVYNRNSFQPLALHVFDPSLFAVAASSPYKTLKDLVAAAKERPGKITIVSGILNDAQFGIMQFEKMAGIKLAQVTFDQGTAPAVSALLGGKIEVFCGNAGDVLAQFKSGDVRILGIMDQKPSPFYPGVKTFEQQGYKLYNGSARGFSAPAGVPKEVIKVLNNAMKEAVATDDHQQKMEGMALSIQYKGSSDYTKFWLDYEKMVQELMPLVKQ
jgi:tripartite-type tricarboxylate transporter receptor subunit TctC